ncbi:hypothetical protein LEMLEM_LOCUS8125 [Lemmus lemmus]
MNIFSETWAGNRHLPGLQRSSFKEKKNRFSRQKMAWESFAPGSWTSSDAAGRRQEEHTSWFTRSWKHGLLQRADSSHQHTRPIFNKARWSIRMTSFENAEGY